MAVVEEIPNVADDVEAQEVAAARKEKITAIGVPLGTALGLLLLWEAGVTLFGVPTYIAPAPSDVAVAFVEKFPILMQNFWPTLFESVAGFAVGNIAAILIAVAFVHSRHVERAFFPIAVFINTIPILAIAPILVLIFGPGITAKVVIAALICFFPTLVNMVRGLQSVSDQALELARILSASRSEVFWKMRLPSSLPFLFSALKISATTSVIGAIVGEWVGADLGLGALIIESTFNFNSPLLYATVFMSSGLSVAMFAAVSIAERLVVRW
ncbi:NitT/TauT family transport system permease protein [Tranquillimonas rosea]|uniref:NitT/TauT family transport system permease protein n=1 Tax=Tranquillimonas rosea TaxID=641238 RepID=A0A1H9SIK1_9RHOB|nr:ABC transporter permease [Tranquillimonas rosea]SER84718.1 NitT/TauT family transport system permease protein [Tranquillimonas rosea]